MNKDEDCSSIRRKSIVYFKEWLISGFELIHSYGLTEFKWTVAAAENLKSIQVTLSQDENNLFDSIFDPQNRYRY